VSPGGRGAKTHIQGSIVIRYAISQSELEAHIDAEAPGWRKKANGELDPTSYNQGRGRLPITAAS